MSRSLVSFTAASAAAAACLALAGGCSAVLGIDNEYALEERGAASSGSASGGGASASSGGGSSATSSGMSASSASGAGGAAGSGGGAGGAGGGPPPVCGNGVIEGEEECDDGNASDKVYCDACDMKCQIGFEHPVTHHCYGYSQIDTSWSNGQAACMAYAGAHLAALTTQEEIDFIIATSPPQEATWIGASDEAAEGQFTWVTGEAFTFVAKVAPWKMGEPGGDGDCVEMKGLDSAVLGQLNDDTCGANRKVLCELSPPGMLP